MSAPVLFRTDLAGRVVVAFRLPCFRRRRARVCESLLDSVQYGNQTAYGPDRSVLTAMYLRTLAQSSTSGVQ
jgi:hypothetical protein